MFVRCAKGSLMGRYSDIEAGIYTRSSNDPDRIVIVGICDPHCSVHNPAPYKVDYWPALRTALEQTISFASKKDADAIVWAGDIFHLKSASRNPLYFMADVIEMMRGVLEVGMANLTIAGNHDVKYGSLEGLEGQPLDLLLRAGVMTLLDNKPVNIRARNFDILLSGQSFRHGYPLHPKEFNRKGSTFHLHTGHFWFGPKSGNFFG